jgi:hypothetical protein
MSGAEDASEANEVPDIATENPLGIESAEVTALQSTDGKAHLEFAPAGLEIANLGRFETKRGQDGMRSAHEVMDAAEAAGASPPAELRASLSSHPEFVDLLRDEPASIGFWRERATDRDRDGELTDTSGDERSEALNVARQMVAESESRPEAVAFEPPEAWIGEINAPGRDTAGRDENCVFCGLATEMRWRGETVQAGEWPHEYGVSFETADELIGPLKGTSASEIERALSDAGPGASGVVVIDQRFNEGHVVNVVNDRGDVRWVDGQIGTVDSVSPRQATGFRWSARDREGRPM